MEKDAKKLMLCLLDTLKFLHEQDIVHRDLKPENLILTSKDSDTDLKIADFGLASFMSNL